jgi:hypothetical protein
MPAIPGRNRDHQPLENSMTLTITTPPAWSTTVIQTGLGPLTVPSEPINDWLHITPSVGMTDEGRSRLLGRFVITHTPTGLTITSGSACIWCCRTAGEQLDRLDVDWATLADEAAGPAHWSSDARQAYLAAITINAECDADSCLPTFMAPYDAAVLAEGEGDDAVAG